MRAITGVIPGFNDMHETHPLLCALRGLQEAEAELGKRLRASTESSPDGFSDWLKQLFSFSQYRETALSQAHTDAAFACWRKLGHAMETLELCLEASNEVAAADRQEITTALQMYRRIYQQAEPLVRPSAQGNLRTSAPEPLAQAHQWLDEHIDPLTLRLKELDHQAHLKNAARQEIKNL